MKTKGFIAGALMAAGVLAWATSARAGDTMLLNGVKNTPTQTLVDDGSGADTVRV